MNYKYETDEQWAKRRSQELANETGKPQIVMYVLATGSVAIGDWHEGCEKRGDYLYTVQPEEV